MRLMLPYLFEDWVSWGPPQLSVPWIQKHSNFTTEGRKASFFTLKIIPGKKSKQWSQKAQVVAHTTLIFKSEKERRNQRLWIWGSLLARLKDYRKEYVEIISTVQAHRRCKMKCLYEWTNEWIHESWRCTELWLTPCDYLIKRASLVKEVAKIPWRSLKEIDYFVWCFRSGSVKMSGKEAVSIWTSCIISPRELNKVQVPRCPPWICWIKSSEWCLATVFNILPAGSHVAIH